MNTKVQQRLAEKTRHLGRTREAGQNPESTAAQPPVADPAQPVEASGTQQADASLAAPADASAAAPVDVSPAPVADAPAGPPVSTSRSSRSPVTMPGALGAFRNEAQKYVQQIAERDAIIEELRNATDRVLKISLSLVDDSPYQPRLEYDPEEIDALAKTMAAATQADPIKVRKVGERYELIGGHRRKRAALSLGWTEIDAIVESRSDAEAELETMLLVVANVKLSDFELAEMYHRALDKGFAKNKDKAAAMFGVTPSAVTGRLEMLSLPQEILQILRERPRLFSYSTAGVIKALVQDHPKHLDIIVRGVRRLYEENAKQNSLKGWILQAIAQQTRKAAPKAGGLIVTNKGREVFTTKKTATAVTVNIKARNVDSEQLEKDLHAWLTQYAIDTERD